MIRGPSGTLETVVAGAIVALVGVGLHALDGPLDWLGVWIVLGGAISAVSAVVFWLLGLDE